MSQIQRIYLSFLSSQPVATAERYDAVDTNVELMLYELANDCPIPWPEHPKYPIDAVAGPSRSAASIPNAKKQHASAIVRSEQIRTRYLGILYDSDDSKVLL